MSPQRFRVTSVQLRLANKATITARRTQKSVERNRIGGRVGEPRPQRQNAVHPACQSIRRKSVKRSVESVSAPRHTSVVGGESLLKNRNKIAVGAGILLMGVSLLAMRPHAA